jgi:transposase
VLNVVAYNLEENMATIIKTNQGKKTYYYYHETYREKINKKCSGKNRGSGKSKVCTRNIYLGSAEQVLKCIKEKRKPLTVKVRQFGLIAAAYQVSKKIGLIKIFKKNITGNRYTVPRWIYFFVTIINRLDHATSKNKMSPWLKKTVLPQLLDFDPKKLTSKSFWYATDDIISEKEMQRRRETKETEDPDQDQDQDIIAGIEDATFNAIETELFHSIDNLMGLSPSVICYDTTNFYTYIEEPPRAKLARTCHSKDSKHHLKHIGLLMAVEKSYGVPLISRVYRANSHDSKLFSFILADLISSLKKICNSDSQLVLVLDKGNNSQDNFNRMAGKISWVGALVPSHYEELIDIEFDQYHGDWKGKRFYRCKKDVMGTECAIVLVFNSATKRKQQHSLKRGIEKLTQDIVKKWESYKKSPKAITQGIETMKNKSRYGKFIEVSLGQNQLHFQENAEEIEKREKRFGKNLIFSNMLEATTGYLIDIYTEKNIIESDFQLLKDTTIIRFRPIRHWTDSKIRAYAFCCVVSMTLVRVMQWMVEQAGYKMSPNVLKDELTDIEEVINIYSLKEAERMITQRSAVQEKLWEIFNLEEIKKMLLLH